MTNNCFCYYSFVIRPFFYAASFFLRFLNEETCKNAQLHLYEAYNQHCIQPFPLGSAHTTPFHHSNSTLKWRLRPSEQQVARYCSGDCDADTAGMMRGIYRSMAATPPYEPRMKYGRRSILERVESQPIVGGGYRKMGDIRLGA